MAGPSVSLSDILTAGKNLVTAINTGVSTYLGLRGLQLFYGVTAATAVSVGAGRVSKISVTSGTGGGMAYDSKSASNLTNPLFAIPTVVGVYVIDMPFNNGLVIAPGASTSVSGAYSTGPSVGYVGG